MKEDLEDLTENEKRERDEFWRENLRNGPKTPQDGAFLTSFSSFRCSFYVLGGSLKVLSCECILSQLQLQGHCVFIALS